MNTYLMRASGRVVGKSALLLLAVVVLLTLAPLSPPDHVVLAERLQAPGATHWLGTDPLGRDLLSRLLAGARITLGLALSAVALAGLVGTLVGLLAGYAGGIWDALLMRLVDMQLALPTLLLALLVIAVLGPGVGNLVCVLALTGWTRYARIVRGQALMLRDREFILSAHAIGAGAWRIMLRHLLPNLLAPVLVIATLELARLIVVESALSYLGLGVQPPTASWGRMLAEGQVYLASAWWVVTFPGLAIVLSVLCINLAGDRLRHRFDPRP